MQWIHGQYTPAPILWLQGPMGSGKTPILQSIAERCHARGTLLASFFFSEFDCSRNHTSPLIATISYQMSVAIPELRSRLESILVNDPLVFEKSLEAQVQSLIVAPLMDLAASGFFNDRKTTPRVVLLDGLDECAGAQGTVLRVMASALRTYRPPLLFLIGSRPTVHITYTFESPELRGLWASLILEDVLGLNSNVRKFLVDAIEGHSQLPVLLTIPAAAILGTHWVLVKLVNEYRSGHSDRLQSH
jgi:hypothetical protein